MKAIIRLNAARVEALELKLAIARHRGEGLRRELNSLDDDLALPTPVVQPVIPVVAPLIETSAPFIQPAARGRAAKAPELPDARPPDPRKAARRISL